MQMFWGVSSGLEMGSTPAKKFNMRNSVILTYGVISPDNREVMALKFPKLGVEKTIANNLGALNIIL